MKKNLLALIVFAFAGIFTSHAQVVNASFENWYLDTFYFPPGLVGTLPADTISFYDPTGWTSSNALTDLDSTARATFVTKSSNAYSGNSAIQLRTDTVHFPGGIGHLPVDQAVIPGFALNGIFPFLNVPFTGSVKVIRPIDVPGAGQPLSQRLQSFSGFYNYTPVYNANTHSNDTCVIWATLRQGRTPIADAIFKSTSSTGGYVPFTANFNYYSCLTPDTLVVLISSSATDVLDFLSLPGGSVLLVDSLTYDTLPASFQFAPFVQNEVITAIDYHSDTINVLANDTDCSGQPLTMNIITGPYHGTATILSNQDIVYTPNPGYTYYDTIIYRDTNVHGDTTDGFCLIFVNANTGIAGPVGITFGVYPVPADNTLHIELQNPGGLKANMYDVVGRLVMQTELNGNNNTVDVHTLPAGMYAMQLVNAAEVVVGRNKFVIER